MALKGVRTLGGMGRKRGKKSKGENSITTGVNLLKKRICVHFMRFKSELKCGHWKKKKKSIRSKKDSDPDPPHG